MSVYNIYMKITNNAIYSQIFFFNLSPILFQLYYFDLFSDLRTKPKKKRQNILKRLIIDLFGNMCYRLQ